MKSNLFTSSSIHPLPSARVLLKFLHFLCIFILDITC
jgi:hypothetical protein